jgi:hypothetical protein
MHNTRRPLPSTTVVTAALKAAAVAARAQPAGAAEGGWSFRGHVGRPVAGSVSSGSLNLDAQRPDHRASST